MCNEPFSRSIEGCYEQMNINLPFLHCAKRTTQTMKFFIKVYKSVYIAQSGQWHNITLNNFLLHVLNHALKRFLIEVLIDLINYGILDLFNKNMFSRVTKSWLRG